MTTYILAGAFTFWLSTKVLDIFLTRALKKLEREKVEAERINLDWTIRQAYTRGALDAVRRKDIEIGMESYLMEWRDRWGFERRETSK